jgi:predicted heme/steroid binding protein
MVGVIKGHKNDPCTYPIAPPVCDQGRLTYWTMSEVRASTGGCVTVVNGKVYDLAQFANYHYGGKSEILERCRQDISDDFREYRRHTEVHLGTVQKFQVGVIKYSEADPCDGQATTAAPPVTSVSPPVISVSPPVTTNGPPVTTDAPPVGDDEEDEEDEVDEEDEEDEEDKEDEEDEEDEREEDGGNSGRGGRPSWWN